MALNLNSVFSLIVLLETLSATWKHSVQPSWRWLVRTAASWRWLVVWWVNGWTVVRCRVLRADQASECADLAECAAQYSPVCVVGTEPAVGWRQESLWTPQASHPTHQRLPASAQGELRTTHSPLCVSEQRACLT